jgi:uncharacterized membrane protein
MSEQINPTPDIEITSDDRLWAMLSYILSPIVPIILLLIPEKRNRPFIKAHLAQSLVFGVAVYLISAILGGFILGTLIRLAGFIAEIVWGLAANRGEYVFIPWITDLCKKQGWA